MKIKINWTRSVSVLLYFKNDELQKITTWKRGFFYFRSIITMKRPIMVPSPLMSKYFP